MLSNHRAELIAAVLASVALVALSFAWTVPIMHGGDRALIAFGQHYSLYLSVSNKLSMINHPFYHWELIIKREFPSAGSDFQAIVLYPTKVIPYLIFNAQNLFVAIIAVMLRISVGSLYFYCCCCDYSDFWVVRSARMGVREKEIGAAALAPRCSFVARSCCADPKFRGVDLRARALSRHSHCYRLSWNSASCASI